MAQLLKELEGTWEEILTHSDDLAGHQVQVKVMEPKPETLTVSQKILADGEEAKRIKLTPEDLKIRDEMQEFNRKHPVDFRWIGDDK